MQTAARFPRTEREATNNTNATRKSAPQFPRTQREAGWSNAEWEGKEDGSGIVSALLWALVGSVVLWIFLALVLGWR